MACFDTPILIWGIRACATPGQENMIVRAKRYISHLSDKKVRVVIPTPVLAEYLIGVPKEDRDSHRAILERNFLMPALDIRAAQLAADLQSDTEMMKTLRKQHGVDRQSLRTDAMIIAIAIVNGVQKIVTNDIDHFRKLAQGQILVDGLPDIVDQATLFEQP
jgi:predicted nucleic acid-binding protein